MIIASFSLSLFLVSTFFFPYDRLTSQLWLQIRLLWNLFRSEEENVAVGVSYHLFIRYNTTLVLAEAEPWNTCRSDINGAAWPLGICLAYSFLLSFLFFFVFLSFSSWKLLESQRSSRMRYCIPRLSEEKRMKPATQYMPSGTGHGIYSCFNRCYRRSAPPFKFTL